MSLYDLASNIKPEHYDQLDTQSKTNRMFEEKKRKLFREKIKWAGGLFHFISNEKVDSLCKLAMEKDFQTKAFMAAMDKVVEDYDKFPSFKVIAELVNNYSVKKETYNFQESQQSNKEAHDHIVIREKFIKEFGAEKLGPFVDWWFKETYPELSESMLKGYSIDMNMWERCALFDWRDTGYTRKMSDVIETSKKKIGVKNE